MYDIFAVSFSKFNKDRWKKIKSKYPSAILHENVKSFSDLSKSSFTKMFWVIWDDIVLSKDFNLNEYKATKWDDQYLHIFKNGEYHDGICLFPKSLKLTNEQFRTRSFENKKEVDIIASQPTLFDKFTINSYDDYVYAFENSTTEMFWCIPDDIDIVDDFRFDYQVPKYNQNIPHVFLNGSHRDGISILPADVKLSKKEVNHRFYINKCEINVLASSPKQYDKFLVKSYEDYLDAIDNTSTEMFWALWPEIEVTDESVFATYFSHHDSYNRKENHAWAHQFRKDETTFGGLHLMSKQKPVSKKEIDFRFLINKKEHNEIVSKHRTYDIVFISYNEPNADDTYEALKQRFPKVKRVHGVKGIHQAHIAAAKLCDTEMFWVVDGDAVVLESFDFEHVVNRYELSTVHVWQSINPINGLVYGYGGIKLLPTSATLNMDTSVPDMTTSISDRFTAVQEVSNITAFNTDPFNTWKGAFRECAKLASRVINRQKEDETNERLKTWTTVGHNRKFGEYAILGAKSGMEFGLSNQSDIKLINDFDWLKQRFDSEVQ